MDISIPYYQDSSRISNSAIGWFLKNGPSFLRKKLDGKIPDEKGSQLERGTMIHEYILQPEEFDKDYMLFNGTKPKSSQQETFCNLLINTVEIEPEKAAITAYKGAYRTIGKQDQSIASEASKLALELNSYITAIRDGRTLISDNDLHKCMAVCERIKEHKAANKLLGDPNYEEHHEFHINWEYNGVKCKSLLDCVKFDYTTKKCQLIDLKTTVKLWHFEESIATYDYLRQLCFYKMAIMWYLEHEKGEKIDEWKFEYYIIAIDSGIYDSDIRVFKFTEEQVLSRFKDIVDTLLKIEWHQKNSLWEYTKEYYDGDGCEILNI